jgi:geranylgeranyl diphosphate synthase type II
MSGTLADALSHKQAIEAELDAHIARGPQPLLEAMRYSVLNGGKRLRGLLCLLSCSAVNPSRYQQAMPVAAGLECVHAMSLVHDDLPCMDDDDLRRGKPTCHRVYGEAVALLAGDALLVEGIGMCLQAGPEVARVVIGAIGCQGMTGGQMLDLSNLETTVAELEQTHLLKTGALLSASVVAGGMVGGATAEQLSGLRGFGNDLGLAFQIFDDLLDYEGSEAQLGKAVGKDASRKKITYPGLLGLAEAHQRAAALIADAKSELARVGLDTPGLSEIADFVVKRRS